MVGTSEDRAREKFAILLLVEPGALEIEQRNTGQVRERERIDGELRERLIRRRIRLVIQDVDRAVAYLHEVDMAGEDALAV
jgi:hypothetical protein